jgi:hypothetical protein
MRRTNVEVLAKSGVEPGVIRRRSGITEVNYSLVGGKGMKTMVTGYPQVLVAPHTATDAQDARIPRVGFVTRIVRRLGQLICGLSGHDYVRHYEQNRASLCCASCGHVSPGWELTAPLPQLRYSGDPERHVLHTSRARVISHARRRVA